MTAEGPILLIDTATTRAVIALGTADGTLIEQRLWTAGYRHGEELLARIDGLLTDRGVALADRKFDPRTDYNGVFADPTAFAGKVRLLWLGVGTREPERMRAGLLRLHSGLEDAHIQHVFYESPETDHEWQTWRRDLKDFAPRLF